MTYCSTLKFSLRADLRPSLGQGWCHSSYRKHTIRLNIKTDETYKPESSATLRVLVDCSSVTLLEEIKGFRSIRISDLLFANGIVEMMIHEQS
jgi:hypothetical protein